MNTMLAGSAYFGVVISIMTFMLGRWLAGKWRFPLVNPILISIASTITVLLLTKTEYADYYAGAKTLSYLLTPATICLAVPLYEKIALLKKNAAAILLGITGGVMTTMLYILLMASLFGLSHQEYVTFLPKSITTAIGMGVSEELGGYVTLTVAIIILTGLTGNIFAPLLFRLFHIEDSIAKGVALGTSSHALGTARALAMGETEAAMSSLSVVVAGLLTVVTASVFAQFL